MRILPDPRRYSATSASPLVALAQRLAQTPASQHDEPDKSLEQAVARLLAEARADLVQEAIREAPCAAICRTLLEAVDSALVRRLQADGAQIRLFAIPIVVVTGGEAGAVVPSAVGDAAELTRVFEAAGALGPVRNFGFSNALTSRASLEAVSWTALLRIAQSDEPVELGPLALEPEDIVLHTGEDQVDLRFLPGAAVTRADAPTFLETAGAIGRWGIPFTRTLAKQLSTRAATVLPIPRPPMGFVRAAHAGSFARAELGFQLFVSNALRRARSRFGDPDVCVAAHSDATVRVRLTSPLDESFVEEYRWALGPADDLDEVARSILDLLAEVRLDRVAVLDTVQPAAPGTAEDAGDAVDI
ncbi:MAG TPA: hypothetical protein VNM24_09385 [Burkholderiales bacterium]|jgi:hypothetical protein|nr:hypothetical protein [Burkholderiales bacterium]